MAKLITRALTRETCEVDPQYHEPLMIKIEPGSKCLKIWRKGSRHPLSVRYQDIWRLGFNAQVADLRSREKKLGSRRLARLRGRD